MVSHFLGITAFVNNFDMMVKDASQRRCIRRRFDLWIRMVLGDHWNIEATAGVGVLRYRQFKHDKVPRNRVRSTISKTTIAPVKLGYPLFILFDNEH